MVSKYISADSLLRIDLPFSSSCLAIVTRASVVGGRILSRWYTGAIPCTVGPCASVKASCP